MAKSLRPEAPGTFARTSPGTQDIQVVSQPVDTSVQYGAEGMPAPPDAETPLAPYQGGAGQQEMEWAQVLAAGAQALPVFQQIDLAKEKVEIEESAVLANEALKELLSLNLTQAEALEQRLIQPAEHPAIQKGRSRADAMLLDEAWGLHISEQIEGLRDTPALDTLEKAEAFFKTSYDAFITDNKPAGGRTDVFEEASGLARRETIKSLMGQHAVWLGRENQRKIKLAIGHEIGQVIQSGSDQLQNDPEASLTDVVTGITSTIQDSLLDDENRHADGTADTLSRGALRRHVGQSLIDLAVERPDLTHLIVPALKGLQYGPKGQDKRSSVLRDDQDVAAYYNDNYSRIQTNLALRTRTSSPAELRKQVRELGTNMAVTLLSGPFRQAIDPQTGVETQVQRYDAPGVGRTDYARDIDDGLIPEMLNSRGWKELFGDDWAIDRIASSEDEVVIRNIKSGDIDDKVVFNVQDLADRAGQAFYDQIHDVTDQVIAARVQEVRTLLETDPDNREWARELQILTDPDDPHGRPHSLDQYTTAATASLEAQYVPRSVREVVQNGLLVFSPMSDLANAGEEERSAAFETFMTGYRYWEAYDNVSPALAGTLFDGMEGAEGMQMLYETISHEMHRSGDYRGDPRAVFNAMVNFMSKEGGDALRTTGSWSEPEKQLLAAEPPGEQRLIRDLAEMQRLTSRIMGRTITTTDAITQAKAYRDKHYSNIGGDYVSHRHFGYENMRFMDHVKTALGGEDPNDGRATQYLQSGDWRFHRNEEGWAEDFLLQLPPELHGDLTAAQYRWESVQGQPNLWQLRVLNPTTQSWHAIANPSEGSNGYFDIRIMSPTGENRDLAWRPRPRPENQDWMMTEEELEISEAQARMEAQFPSLRTTGVQGGAIDGRNVPAAGGVRLGRHRESPGPLATPTPGEMSAAQLERERFRSIRGNLVELEPKKKKKRRSEFDELMVPPEYRGVPMGPSDLDLRTSSLRDRRLEDLEEFLQHVADAGDAGVEDLQEYARELLKEAMKSRKGTK